MRGCSLRLLCFRQARDCKSVQGICAPALSGSPELQATPLTFLKMLKMRRFETMEQPTSHHPVDMQHCYTCATNRCGIHSPGPDAIDDASEDAAKDAADEAANGTEGRTAESKDSLRLVRF